MPKFRFNQDRTVQGAGGPSYKAGQLVELSKASAERWLRRGCGEIVAEDDPPELDFETQIDVPPMAAARDELKIPEDWHKLKAGPLMELAAQLAPGLDMAKPRGRGAAAEIVEAELARRAAESEAPSD